MMIAEPLIFVATPFGFPYYFVLYLIYNVAYTFCTANLSPLTIEMTDDFKERTYLTGYKHLFGNAAGFLMAALVGFGFGTFGETNPFSYFIIATINASVMAISLLCVYLSTWEHTPEEVAQEKIESVGEGIKKFFIDVISTFRNKSFRKVLYAQVSTKLAAACWSACLSFFIVYCLQIPKSYESVMEMPGKVVAIVCTAIWVALMAKKGFHKSWYLANVGCASSTCPMFCSTTSPMSMSSSPCVVARASTAPRSSSASKSPRLSPSTCGLSSLLPPASFRPPAIATP